MKVKLDENMPSALGRLLSRAGHDVSTVADENLSGATDSRLLEAATDGTRLFVAFDVDFADARTYPPGGHQGIVVFRLRDQRWMTLERRGRHLIESGALERLGGGIAIVTEERIRVRAATR